MDKQPPRGGNQDLKEEKPARAGEAARGSVSWDVDQEICLIDQDKDASAVYEETSKANFLSLNK